LGGFIWSPEEGTAALKLEEKRVSEKTARLRYNALIEMQEEISREKNEALVGQTLDVILDSTANESEFLFHGRTQGNALESDNIVRISKGKGIIGSIKKVKITKAQAHELDGVLC
jgi:ribosomal protein S12 methylthiotransferase